MSRLNISSLLIVVMNLDHLIWWCSWRCIFQTGVWICKNFLLRGDLVNHLLDQNEETYGSCLAVICKGPYWRWIHLCDHDHCGRYHYGDRLCAHDWLIECNWNLYVNYEVSCLLYDKTSYPVCLSFVYRFSFGFGKMRSWIGHHVFDVCDLKCLSCCDMQGTLLKVDEYHQQAWKAWPQWTVDCPWGWMKIALSTMCVHAIIEGGWIPSASMTSLTPVDSGLPLGLNEDCTEHHVCACNHMKWIQVWIKMVKWKLNMVWIHIGLCDLYWEEAHTVLWPFVLVPTMWKNGHVEQVEFDLCS